MRFDLRVNGTVRTIDTPPLRRLLDILREDLDLTGTKEGCGEGECGACAVLLDGRLVNACLVPALQLPGREVVTIEGLGTAEHPDPVQRAFMDEGAAQCGFCIPGMVMASRALLDAEPRPTRDAVRHGLAGNLCRCTGYERILRAVERAAAISPAPTDARGARRRATGSPPVAQRAIATAQGCRADGPRLLTPTTLDEAVNALPGLGPDRLLVAGATDLMVELHAARRAPSAIMDLTRIRELARIRVTDTSIRIGAATTFAELAAEPAVARELPAVAAMARQIGAVAIQNR
ncbi:MAG: 2Fe-2S iron-sulfur cluster-binding protein, partial [Candidatus Eiseniibacteriota bacterium]